MATDIGLRGHLGDMFNISGRLAGVRPPAGAGWLRRVRARGGRPLHLRDPHALERAEGRGGVHPGELAGLNRAGGSPAGEAWQLRSG